MSRELDLLEEYLNRNNIEYKRIDDDTHYYNLHQIVVYENGERIWDVVCHRGSYGYKEGLLEVMGRKIVSDNLDDDVEGWLTAEEIIRRIEA